MPADVDLCIIVWGRAALGCRVSVMAALQLAGQISSHCCIICNNSFEPDVWRLYEHVRLIWGLLMLHGWQALQVNICKLLHTLYRTMTTRPPALSPRLLQRWDIHFFQALLHCFHASVK
jgi:hypothetical protein